MKAHRAHSSRHFVQRANKRAQSATGKRKAAVAQDADYKNPNLPPERRVKDLLSRMTLEEKAAQMLCIWQKKADLLVDAKGNFDPQKARAAFKDGHGLGQVGRPSDAGKGKNRNSRAGSRRIRTIGESTGEARSKWRSALCPGSGRIT